MCLFVQVSGVIYWNVETERSKYKWHEVYHTCDVEIQEKVNINAILKSPGAKIDIYSLRNGKHTGTIKIFFYCNH